MDCIVHGVAKSWTRLSNFYFYQKSPSFCQKLPSFCQVSLTKKTLFLSEIFQSAFLRKVSLSVRNQLSVRFLSQEKSSFWKKTSFFQYPSEIFFLSGFSPRKDLSVRKLLFIRFPSEMFLFLSGFSPLKKPHSFCQQSPSVGFSSEMSFFLSMKTFFLSDIAFLAVFPQKHPSFCQKFFLSGFSLRKDLLSEIPFFV